MKIIAKMGSDEFLVSASESELLYIAGYNSKYGLKDCELPSIGKQINVSDPFAALRVSRGRKLEVEKLANQLRDTAKRVDTINAALAAPIGGAKAGDRAPSAENPACIRPVLSSTLTRRGISRTTMNRPSLIAAKIFSMNQNLTNSRRP